MKAKRWEIWPENFHFKVAQCQFSNWAGSGYKFARNRFGFYCRFLTQKAAERHANRLNERDGL